MSHKAIFNGRNKYSVVVLHGWSSGYSTGTGIPYGMCRYGSSRRLPNGKHLRNENHNKIMSIVEAEIINREKGIVYPYTRNCTKFIMSRAARKRGFVTQDYFYNDKVKRAGKPFSNIIVL